MTTSTGPLTLSHYLPRKAWWLIYISRKDHKKALESGHPADYYDNDQSPGYRAGIEAAFEFLFEQTPPLATIDSKLYHSLHELAISKLTGDTGGELVNEWSTGDRDEVIVKGEKQAGSVRFPMTHPRGSRPIAADLKTEQFTLDTGQIVHVLTEPDEKDVAAAKRMLESIEGTQEQLYACLYNVEAGMISVNYRRHMGPKLVDAVGARFALELKSAGSPRERLAAIAKLIRALHVLHPFTNANGRLNITLLLTKLLLDQGYGPVALSNQDDLFSGSYTVDEMVGELEREIEAFDKLAQQELARQDREGDIPPVKISVPEEKMKAAKENAERCSIQ